MFSCGERSNHSAQLAGHARLFGANLGYDSPYIAVIASERMREEMVDHPNQDGKVHLYSGPGTRPMTPRGEAAPPQGPRWTNPDPNPNPNLNPNPKPLDPQCHDVPGWTDYKGRTCADYTERCTYGGGKDTNTNTNTNTKH